MTSSPSGAASAPDAGQPRTGVHRLLRPILVVAVAAVIALAALAIVAWSNTRQRGGECGCEPAPTSDPG